MINYFLYRVKWFLAKWFVPKYPVHVDFELSNICNLKCSFCPQSLEIKDWEPLVMKFDMYKKIIDEIQGKVSSIKFNLRGESTLHPEFIQFLEYTKGKFIDSRVNTNGQYRDISISRAMVENLKEISFSVDAFCADTYKMIRGGDYYLLKKNINNCIYWANYTKANTKIVLSFTVTEANKLELQDFVTYWRRKYHNISFRIRPVWDRTSEERNRGTLKRKNCYMPNRRLVVAANGDVYPCCVQWHKPFTILGNVNSESLLNIWNSFSLQFIRIFLTSFDTFYHELPDSCKNCDSSESYVLGDE